ncbi:family 43 glycosylhydrolase (plasmid) [Halorussus salilacus]|uniref:family 43 glycosylhydrolase n=1 Tax=Halorussus salilacus TaxID=2953750 RepID=UPI00209D4086|nr:family 43 glycosylhydrolase [Halorussus salilacus]USZ69841.1 family 43 glycosylhydrolase [Halorussus salilacus]
MNRRTFLNRTGAAVVGGGVVGGGVVGGGVVGGGVVGDETVRRAARRAARRDGGEYRNPVSDRYRNPVFERVFPDPGAVRAPDGTYFAYATYHDWDRDRGGGGSGRTDERSERDDEESEPWDGNRPLVPILRSPDLVDWEFVGPAFEEKPDWHESVGVWAPDVVRYGGEYLLYYSLSSWGDPNPGIGVASADSPEGPFEDRGRLLRSEGVGVPNSIDPCPVVEAGTPYLFWGSHRGIYGVRLGGDGRSLAGEKFQVAGDGVEAPSLLARDGRYYLFGSRGRCCAGADSDYRVVVGRADDLRGPYRNRAGEDLLDAPGMTILRGNDRFAGPGHNAVARDDAGDDWLVYHAYERADPWVGQTPRRVLMIDRLRWREGWPAVPDGSPSLTAPKPSVTSGDASNRRET